MTTDDTRKLLELAANAAGIDVMYFSELDAFVGNETPNDEWNPATDDGDSARLEATLGIDVNWFEFAVECSDDGTFMVEQYADHSSDKQAARRMATLRLAAEIGRRMKDD